LLPPGNADGVVAKICSPECGRAGPEFREHLEHRALAGGVPGFDDDAAETADALRGGKRVGGGNMI